MRRALLPTIVIAAVAAIALLPAAAHVARGPGTADQRAAEALPARAELNQSFRLDPRALVSVTGIAGPVTVTTGDGDRAEVHIVRLAATERELQCYRTEVHGGGARLTIEHVQDSDRRGCVSIRSRQEVRLVLPRNVDLSLSTIAGAVEIAPIDGRLRLDSIAGHASVAGVRSADLSSLADGLSITFGTLDARGVAISSVVGAVDLNFRPDANADVTVSSVQGNVRSNSAAQRPFRFEDGEASVRIGAGGPPVSVSAVVGEVALHGI
jgi:hypothetical protein